MFALSSHTLRTQMFQKDRILFNARKQAKEGFCFEERTSVSSKLGKLYTSPNENRKCTEFTL